MLKWLRNRNFLLFLAILAGLLAGQAAPWLEPLALPALGLVMTLALVEVSRESFSSPKFFLVPLAAGLLLNFGLHGGLILLLSAFLAPTPAIYTGFVLVAAVPPAVAVVPFTMLLKGDRDFSFRATVGGYLAALGLTPLIVVVLVGSAFIHPFKILKILVLLIFLPLLASRLLRLSGWLPHLETYRGALTNWSFALITYTIIGLNRDLFFQEPWVLAYPVLISLAGTFGLGSLISLAGRILRLRKELTVSLMMLGTLKNAALAGGLALNLFGQETAVPATVTSVFLITYLIWLSFWQERRKRQEGAGVKSRSATASGPPREQRGMAAALISLGTHYLLAPDLVCEKQYAFPPWSPPGGGSAAAFPGLPCSMKGGNPAERRGKAS